MQTDVAVDLGGHVAKENQNQHQTYKTALKGNWQEAKRRLEADPDAIRYSIAEATFVKELVQFLTPEDLERKDINRYTALCFAAQLEIVIIAKEMMKKSANLPLICSSKGRTPLHIAALLGRRDMVSCLFSVTPSKDLTLDERMEILVATITYDMYDIALKIRDKDETLETANKRTLALRELARKPLEIGSTNHLSLWKRCFNSFNCTQPRFKGICKKALMKTLAYQLVERLSKEVQPFQDRQSSYDFPTILFDAAKLGNAEFLNILISSYPDIIWIADNQNRSLFHIAFLNRQEFKEIILTYVDDKNENILHLARYLAPSSRLNIVSGAALQMQWQLWFKSSGLITGDLFTKHKNLRREGENWMKDTANYCMIVATLITTDTGNPILLKSIWFRVFFISDAIALFSSSILIFLSILTSRFTEMDFLVSLPSKLVLGLTTLFISIAGIVVAFSATCFLVFKSEMTSLPIVIIALAGVPIILFVLPHYQLWVDIIRSTFLSRFLFQPHKNRFLCLGIRF
ncbi:hypothetical protein RGQ29_028074 [Quercus rubra]|uniref:PGG domain-containing protein n=1 Tax=Quercus rubra TaxID=3512 RepID=A0AAN7IEH6_QUERU|nr:hypothetical protein RGQ29_028074 [Quercus rubra]